MEHRSSAVDFPTRTRPHIALACRDVERSRAFYAQLFGHSPTKVRAGYVKFELSDPPLNLTLNQASDPPRQASPAHFGVQVKSTAEVLERRQQMEAAGFGSRSEEGVGCCYAVQDKVWFADPDGHQWEVFVVTEADIPEHTRAVPGQAVGPIELDADATAQAGEAEAPCCKPSCCA